MPELFNSTYIMPPAQKHSETSKEAAVEIADKAPSLRVKVFEYIRKRGEVGATDEEVQLALEMNPSTQRPRRRELQKLGLVHPEGGTRPTRSGRKAQVWKVRN